MNSFPSVLPDDPVALQQLIARHEAHKKPLKKNTEAIIVWADEKQRQKTPYSIVYLHGFKASREEGAPLHRAIAQKFGCNLYLSRLAGHGLKREQPFKHFSSSSFIQSAMDACRIGQKIGEKVLLMGTSTGGSLALYAAATKAPPLSIAGLLLYSPLIHLYGVQSLFLENYIGRSLLRVIPGKNYLIKSPPCSPEEAAIWYSSYQFNGPLVLGKTIQKIITPSLFKDITCPVFIGYYYKNKTAHDHVVSTSPIKRMAERLGTPPEKRVLQNFPHAGSHVIGSSLLSDAAEEVIKKTILFLREKVGLSPLN